MREVALDQHGFVTTAQARDLGISAALLAMMVRRGRVERVSHGVYRVGQVPTTPSDPWMQAVLWTGFPEACLSHDSALDAWEISDINPNEIHVTVAAKRRVERTIPKGYVIHRQDLTPRQMTWWEAIPTVTAATAIRQCLETGVPTYLIRQALERSTKSGLVLAAEHAELTELMEARYAR
jgi:predicted transcriptional regulator of viral defense system